MILKKNTSFKPAWWLKNKHLQTLFPFFYPRKIKFSLFREKFTLSDGDLLILDWSENRFEDKPLLVLLPGLEGSSDSFYIKGMMQKSLKNGFRCVCLHFRGCITNDETAAKKTYHAGKTRDLDEFLEYLFKKEKEFLPIFIVGYSIGGNILLKWLGENQTHSRIKAAVAVSVPFDLVQSSHQLNKGISRLYQWGILKSLRKKVKDKYQNNEIFSNITDLDRIKTIREFDNLITVPMHGFLNVNDYYSQSSSKQYLNKIKNHTLIIHAADDPFLPEQAIPGVQEMSPYVNLEVLPNGGHMGFIEGNIPLVPKFYLERRIMRYFMYLK